MTPFAERMSIEELDLFGYKEIEGGIVLRLVFVTEEKDVIVLEMCFSSS